MLKSLFNQAWKILSSRISPWWLLLALPLLAILPYDEFALAHWRFDESSQAHKVAQMISQKGDFYNASIALVGGFYLLGVVLKRKKLKLLALAMLLSCATAGISSLAVRVLSGRPRPSIHVKDGLYGLRFAKGKFGLMLPNYDYESFPSGHATTAVATATPALILMPAVGVPLTIAAVAVMWARFQLMRHRLTDLYAGIIFGGIFGVAYGLAANKLAGEKNVSPTPNPQEPGARKRKI